MGERLKDKWTGDRGLADEFHLKPPWRSKTKGTKFWFGMAEPDRKITQRLTKCLTQITRVGELTVLTQTQ
ncbi:hypothetical protein RUM43_000538 [Polyplax serrata]|uniref:Uncharacterized protein n=1 Tax=Polyplax serrata TaxID=468196 RepID=A0AAN8SE40_POLSC